MSQHRLNIPLLLMGLILLLGLNRPGAVVYPIEVGESAGVFL